MTSLMNDGPDERRAHYELIDRLAAWCLSPENRDWVADAAEAFFLRDEAYGEGELEWLSLLFAVWLVHDYRSPGLDTAAGRFLAAQGDSLEPGDRVRLATIHEHILAGTDPGRFCLVELLRVRPGEGLCLRDLMTGEVVEVVEREGSHRLHVPEMLLVRTRPFLGATFLDHVVRLPLGRQADLLQGFANLVERVRLEAPDAGPVDVLRRFAPEVFHLCMDVQRPRVGQASKEAPGDALMLCRAHYRVERPEALSDALDGHRSFDARGNDRWLWLSGKKRVGPLAGQRVVLGQALREGRRLVLQTHSRSRLSRGKTLVEQVAGEAVAHLLDELNDPAAVTQRPAQGACGVAPATRMSLRSAGVGPVGDAVLRRQLAARQCREHFRRWLDVAVPALNGRTPREAAREPGLRSRLAQLVRAMEDRLSGDPHAPLDLKQLRRDLGIRPEE